MDPSTSGIAADVGETATTGAPLASASSTTFGVPSIQLGSVHDVGRAKASRRPPAEGRAPARIGAPGSKRAARSSHLGAETPSPRSARVACGMRARTGSGTRRASSRSPFLRLEPTDEEDELRALGARRASRRMAPRSSRAEDVDASTPFGTRRDALGLDAEVRELAASSAPGHADERVGPRRARASTRRARSRSSAMTFRIGARAPSPRTGFRSARATSVVAHPSG